MISKVTVNARKMPVRTCCGCRTTGPRNELVRVVRMPDGEIRLDVTGKLNGRGAYICPKRECLLKAMKNKGLARSLNTEIDGELYKDIEKEIMSIDDR